MGFALMQKISKGFHYCVFPNVFLKIIGNFSVNHSSFRNYYLRLLFMPGKPFDYVLSKA